MINNDNFNVINKAPLLYECKVWSERRIIFPGNFDVLNCVM